MLDTNRVIEIAGEHFQVSQRGPNNNLKLDFSRLVSRQAQGFTDGEKLTIMYETRAALEADGFNVNVRFQQRNANGEWIYWPHLWVNREPAQASTDTSEMQSLRQELAELKAMLYDQNQQSETQSKEDEADF